MYYPGGGTRLDDEQGQQPVPVREQYICGCLAFVVTALVTSVLYSVLVSAVMGLGLVATSVLVIALTMAWFLLWELFVVVWEWRAGRLSRPNVQR
ncbi:hypothetical protein SAMN04487950_0572 [Halogranum rubrum]|uniref:Uncharacterized protein n=1 Tax=Halogranum rubrum TaxID=553466 RepID=A0A1I4BI49_9EURY|nr:hypothetical protein [Halogranum rubrum]SFK68484.1 hypothetical protein SAMN04487950_0572 [Halogranum rubrum]